MRLEKTLREVDVDKVQDYKEDMDTLLVFVCIVLYCEDAYADMEVARPVSTLQC